MFKKLMEDKMEEDTQKFHLSSKVGRFSKEMPYAIGVIYSLQVEKTNNKIDSQYVTFSSHVVVYYNPVHVDKNVFTMPQHGSSQAQS